MEKTKTIYICDRCHKETCRDELWDVSDWFRFYQLCDDCKALFKEYEEKRKELDKQIDNLSKTYRFGIYIPKENDNE